MCGIGGIVHFDGRRVAPGQLKEMADRMIHRGPDDEGYLFAGQVDEGSAVPEKSRVLASTQDYSLGFCHRRLSIIDLSEAGRQPMSNSDGSMWLTYNGEIYNYVELRKELEHHYEFRSQTDSEVLLAAYQVWGEDCLHRLNGMFSFVIYDSEKNILFGARDRFGIKPFYYSWDERSFYFASEIKQLWSTVSGTDKANEHIVEQFVLYGDVNCFEETCFANVFELQGGECFTLDLKSGRFRKRDYYWDQLSFKEDSSKDFEQWIEEFDHLFADSVRLRMRSDVEVGACLSGGLDSSSIVAVASQLSDKPIHTFTSCFDDKRFDEWEFAEAVVNKTGVIPHQIFPQLEQLNNEFDQLIWHLDEPFRTSSVFAQRKVMQAVQEIGIKVLLDGQGADEILAGYHWYLPLYFSELAKSKSVGNAVKSFLELNKTGVLSSADSLPKVMAKSFYYLMQSQFRHARARSSIFSDKTTYQRNIGFPTNFIEVQKQNLKKNLVSLLRYEDRNSMAFSIESRTPFLDYCLVELVLRMPLELRFEGGWTKSVLRGAMEDRLPDSVTWRVDKKGFVTPENFFLQNFLQRPFDDVLNHPRLSAWYNLDALKKSFTEKSISYDQLWRVLCVQQWLSRFNLR